MILELDDEYATEVFEILCRIPFEAATAHDSEPPTKRHSGIEQLIKQLDAGLNAQADADNAAAEADPQAQAEAEAAAQYEADKARDDAESQAEADAAAAEAEAQAMHSCKN